MSFLANLKKLLGRGDGASTEFGICGVWRVTDISVPHPFGQYVLDLRPNGSLAWFAILPTNDVGELKLEGSGTWRASADEVHYTSGESEGRVRYAREGRDLVLDGLPATKIGPGVRCVLVKV
jgi:hypothetical protein